tara:strand:- start:1158 stop:1631 length:474 start_codon:yes stop_codon:yes gene_type:complete
MELYTSLGLSELRPPENAKTKIYRSRIKGVYIAFQVNLEIVAITAFPGLVDKDIGELLEDLKASFFVGGPQVAPRNGGPEPQMIILGTMGLQTEHKVAHTFPCGQLAEDHAEHLVPTGKAPDVTVSLMGFNDTVEDPSGQKLGNLGEDIFSLVHGIF